MKCKQLWLSLVCVLLLASCGSDASNPDAPAGKDAPKVTSIDIRQHGQTQSFSVTRGGDGSVKMETMNSRGQNMTVQSQYNSNGKLIEMISGADRINYLYGPGGRCIEIYFQKQGQRCVFVHDEQARITTQWTITNGDTTNTYIYNYNNNSRTPNRVSMSTRNGIERSYALQYSDEKNRLTQLFESVFPVETVFWLGWPAVYGEYYLKSAELQSAAGGNQPDGMRKLGNEFTFDIQASKAKETISLTSDGSRNWSTVIHVE